MAKISDKNSDMKKECGKKTVVYIFLSSEDILFLFFIFLTWGFVFTRFFFLTLVEYINCYLKDIFPLTQKQYQIILFCQVWNSYPIKYSIPGSKFKIQ